MADDLPYRVEYAKSGRASCKSCKSGIGKDELRLATVVQSAMFDGKMTKWFHFRCFFEKNKPKSTGDIDGFSNIKYDDQKRVESKMSALGGTAAIAGKGKGKVSAKAKQDAVSGYSVEYSKSTRATCRGCETIVAKGVVRISKMVYDSDRAKSYGPYPGWYHLDCFIANRETLEWFLGGEDLPGFKSMGIEEQKELKEKIKKIAPTKRAADEADGPPPAKKTKEEETVMKKQSDKLFSLQKRLEEQLTKRQLIEIFEYNDLAVPAGVSRLVEWLADAIAFGVCNPCPECKSKALRFKNHEYKCYGDFSEFTTCTYSTLEPKRSKIKIPKEFLAEFTFLKGSVAKRFIPAQTSKPTEPKQEARVGIPKPLLGSLIIIEATQADSEVIRAKVLSYGGKVVKLVSKDVLCIISTEENVAKMTAKIKRAQKLDVHVVSEDFLEKCRQDKIELEQHKLADWGGDLSDKLAQAKTKSAGLPPPKSMYKSGETTRKLKLNGLAAVEPESGLEDIAKVYSRGSEIFNCVLGQADVVKGTNSFYKIQLLVDQNKRHYVFRSWGRIGTTIGGTKLSNFSTIQDAILDFKTVFLDKTGNDWENRANFVKRPKYFNIIEMDNMQDDNGELDTKKILATTSDSKLPIAVQELICLLFDVNVINAQMKEFEIDLQKMPLGKISKDQIKKAYKILNELQGMMDKKASRLQFLDASNRFFTVIPHDFGMNAPPLLDNPDSLKEKIGMLDSLAEIELTYKMLKEEATGAQKDAIPVDHHYTQLKTDIDVVASESPVFQLLQRYLDSTHAATHSAYNLEIIEAFTIGREGEGQRFKPFKRLHNRKLLWHGSRLTNFAGILSQGLRIAPPEAPSTGYMFGKGIYFADMVSKSANYCCTSKANPVGILLLCEVALGDMYERHQAEYVTKLPAEKHSTKGMGMTEPPNSEVLADGVVVPMGPGAPCKDVRSSLLYNEFIVYDAAQVQIKYLLKVNFKYNY